jgi:PAS domain S-box-containing protein
MEIVEPKTAVERPLTRNGRSVVSPSRVSSQHHVQFYEDDSFLVDTVAEFVIAGLHAGEGALVVATPAHHTALAECLSNRGINLPSLEACGRYTALDASETLATFMVDAAPDERLFRESVGRVVAEAGREVPGLRVFGEMVALLWAEGKHEAALRLEEYWNNLAKSHVFSLMCAYPIGVFDDTQQREKFARVCGEHSHVAPSESLPTTTEPERLRAIAELQQKAISLEREMARRRDAEAALRRRTDELTSFIETTSVALHWVGPDARIIWANQAEMDMLGYTPEEYIGRPISDFHAGQDAIDDILGRLTRGERLHDYEARLRCKDGSIKDVLIDSSVLWDGDRFVHTQCFTRDITARKRAFEVNRRLFELVAAVNRAEALSEIYDASLDAICQCYDANRASILLFDDRGMMRFNAWRGLSEKYRQAVEGHSPWKRNEVDPQPVCVDDLEKVELSEELRQVIAAEGIRSLAFIPIANDKRLLGKFMIYYDAPHRFTTEEVGLARTIASQIAFAIERHKSGEALERLVSERTASLQNAIAQLEEFSYTVSHDLRAPLRAIEGYSRILNTDYRDHLPENAQNYLDRVCRNTSRMTRLISDVLTLSRLAQTQLRLHPVALAPIIDDILEQHPHMHPPQACVEAGALHTVIGDDVSLMQVISNLLGNAVKFVPPGVTPHVRIWSEQRGDLVRVWIADNGIGIKPEFQGKLFGMFQRLEPEGRYDGTGVGLAIVRKAVERMGGNVGVESDGTNGSRFWIELQGSFERGR